MRLEAYSYPNEGFISAGGVRLHYLEWGLAGPPLILIHGLADNPHVFSDIAPLLARYFRVIAYARRGHGRSEVAPPYDTETLTEDLRALMDNLGIPRAHLAGWSMGGNEITAMAAKYPGRVRGLVYLDGGYDYADPDFKVAVQALPDSLLETPPSALASFDAYRNHQRAIEYVSLDDMRRVEAFLRESVTVQSNGSLRARIDRELQDTLFAALFSNPPRDYALVRSPALAIYAHSTFELRATDAKRCAVAEEWERHYMSPFREKSKRRILTGLSSVEIVDVPGTHNGFVLTSRDRVLELMRKFLGNTTSSL